MPATRNTARITAAFFMANGFILNDLLFTNIEYISLEKNEPTPVKVSLDSEMFYQQPKIRDDS
jgi:hypothetical protein